jgi:hypothetical protein
MSALEYRAGTLTGYEVREYLLEKWHRTCSYCGATGTPLQIDHIQPRAHGGSGRQLWRSAVGLGPPAHAWSGGLTRFNRGAHGLAKSHTLDALAVGELPCRTRSVRYPAQVLTARATGRGSCARTRTDAYGFPRLHLSRRKRHYGFTTGVSYVRSSHVASTREPTSDASPSAPTGATAFPSQAATQAPATRTCACSSGLTDTRTAPGSKNLLSRVRSVPKVGRTPKGGDRVHV